MSEDPAPADTVSDTPAFDANWALGSEVSTLFAKAGLGDLAALRLLRDSCADVVVHRLLPDRPNLDLMVAYGLMSARLCVAHGNHVDGERLATMLTGAASLLGEWGRAEMAAGFAVEALALFERLGARGSEESALAVTQLAVFLDPSMIARAKVLVDQAGE